MTNEEFRRCMDDLHQFYGQKAYPPAMIGLLMTFFAELPFNDGKQVITAVVEKYARTPSVGQIKQEALPYLRRAWDARRQSDIQNLGPCNWCGGSGQVHATAIKKPHHEYAFMCTHCKAAQIRGIKNIPVWQESLEAEYVPLMHDRKFQSKLYCDLISS